MTDSLTYGHPPRRRGAGATGTVTALLGFGMGGVAVSTPIVLLTKLQTGAVLSGGAITVLVLFALAGLVFLAGAATTFIRPAGGLVLLIVGGVLAVAPALLEPVLLGAPYGKFLERSFEFRVDGAYGTVGCLTLAPLVLVLAVVGLIVRGVHRGHDRAVAEGRRAPRQSRLRLVLAANPALNRLLATVVLVALGVTGVLLTLFSMSDWRDGNGVVALVLEFACWLVVAASGVALLGGQRFGARLAIGAATLAFVNAAVEALGHGWDVWPELAAALVTGVVGVLLVRPKRAGRVVSPAHPGPSPYQGGPAVPPYQGGPPGGW
ncbi:hypothetical protein [Amycolatopsis saalfeldensis]|uniref:Uncharacterized protein n=1 Tax=Amycolatopsis saalfeldensis TaxID=394193 RepID=A0A1H8R800_9PSEU|nr:hypothetical protein [Amycolatopsis saalfeldensis]SEO62719.1 hypothetical protein SAMN04489732_101675 [Amycolatopsis saalfeldensis]